MTAYSWWFAYSAFVVFVFGACIGSFLNVCIYRIPLEQSVVRPRSHCPHCGHTIAWYDNIPLVSYLARRARCRHCGAVISPRYFLVEALTATLFLLIWWEYGWNSLTPVYWLIAAALILGTFVDFDHFILPDRVTIGGTALGFALSPLMPQLHGEMMWLDGLEAAVIGWAVGFGVLWMVAVLGKLILRKDAMGFGDVKLLGAIGALFGWRATLFVIVVSSVLGSLVGLTLIMLRKHQWQSRIPYGPYLAGAAMLWMLWGHRLLTPFLNWLMTGGA